MYLAIYCLFATLGLTVRQERSMPWLIAALLFLLWFMGARYYVGCDFTGYLNRFDNTPRDASIIDALQAHEPGFQLVITAVRVFGLDYMWLNVASSALILAGYYVFLKNHFKPLMILTLLFPIMIVQLSMSGIRQGVAVAFLLVASVYFMKGRRILTAFWIVLGAQFHASVLAFLPIAFLAARPVSTIRLMLGVLLLSPIAVLLLGDRADVYQDRYIAQIYGEMSSGGAFVRYSLSLVPAVLFLRYQKKMQLSFPDQFAVFKLFSILIIALLPIGLFSSLALHRLNYFVMPLSAAIFVALSHAIFPRAQKELGRLVPIILYGGYAVFWALLSKHAAECYQPYQNYLLL